MKSDNGYQTGKRIAELRKAKGRLTFYKILNWSDRDDYTHLKNVQSACIFQILAIILIFSNLSRRDIPSDSSMLPAYLPLLLLFWLIAVAIILIRSRKLLKVFEDHTPKSIDELIEKIRLLPPESKER